MYVRNTQKKIRHCNKADLEDKISHQTQMTKMSD